MPSQDIVWNRNPLTAKLAAASALAVRVTDEVLEYHEATAQNYMRQNAPWRDRTGNARQGLFAQHYATDEEHGLVLYHTMPYGIFLETRFSGQYRIIMPAVEHVGREVMTDLKKALRAL